MLYVPVVSSTGKPLMPCHPARARQLVRKGKAIRRFDRGLFYIKLTEREDGEIQSIAVGIDPGSKKEAYTVKSAAHTYLNIQADTVNWVSKSEEVSTTARRNRRQRKCPYRKCRPHLKRRRDSFLPPSTRARWGWKLRICTWLFRYFPIEKFIVEDVCAVTKKGKGNWNKAFSPLEVGKTWFYTELSKIAPVGLVKGYNTAKLRNRLGLEKTKNKISDSFSAHCVDSWALAYSYIKGLVTPDNMFILYISPLRFHRRQLHYFNPRRGGIRSLYGSTQSMGFKRGSWVRHPRYGLCYVSGSSKRRIKLLNIQTGKALSWSAKPEELSFLCNASWRVRYA